MTKRKTDIEYISDSLFVSFMPVSDEGKEVWTQMLAQSGTTKFPFYQLPDIKRQLKNAGYTVRKGRLTKKSDSQLLAELGLE